jgi:DNA-binding GntR family transcriptional regulator
MPRKERSLMERAYEELKRRIITLELAPANRIDDRELAAQLQISRTPIREAIFRLGAEGFIDLRAEGFMVRPLDLLDIAQLFEAHVVLAKAVARLAAQRVTPARLAELSAATRVVATSIEQRDHLLMAASNAALHRLEASASGNAHIEAMAASIHDHGQRLAYLCYGGLSSDGGSDLDAHLRAVALQHEQMLEALSAQDGDRAERVALAHVRLFRRRVEQFLESSEIAGFELTDADFRS